MHVRVNKVKSITENVCVCWREREGGGEREMYAVCGIQHIVYFFVEDT